MRHYTQLLRAAAVAAVLIAIGGAAVAGPLEDAAAAYQRGDYATALQLLRPLGDEGDVTAQSILGSLYARGHGVPQNYTEALKWYRKRARACTHKSSSRVRFRAKRTLEPTSPDDRV
jgi:Sel1 repeat-containing protein